MLNIGGFKMFVLEDLRNNYDTFGNGVIGIHGSPDGGIGIVVANTHHYTQMWQIHAVYETNYISDIEICNQTLKNFEKLFYVKYFLCNDIAQDIFNKPNYKDNEKKICSDWKNIKLEINDLISLIQIQKNGISLLEAESFPNKKMNSIDLTELTNNPNSYRKLFALAYIIKNELQQIEG